MTIRDNSIFDSIIVVTNRVVLDSQLQDTINSFEHQHGLVEAIDDKKNSTHTGTGHQRQKAHYHLHHPEVPFCQEGYGNVPWTEVCDHHRRSPSGTERRKCKISPPQSNRCRHYHQGIRCGSRCLPEDEVDLTDDYINEIIGQGTARKPILLCLYRHPRRTRPSRISERKSALMRTANPSKAPFHVYSMRQAIEEHYILDCSCQLYHHQGSVQADRVSEDNPELIEGQTARALFKIIRSMATPLHRKPK